MLCRVRYRINCPDMRSHADKAGIAGQERSVYDDMKKKKEKKRKGRLTQRIISQTRKSYLEGFNGPRAAVDRNSYARKKLSRDRLAFTSVGFLHCSNDCNCPENCVQFSSPDRSKASPDETARVLRCVIRCARMKSDMRNRERKNGEGRPGAVGCRKTRRWIVSCARIIQSCFMLSRWWHKDCKSEREIKSRTRAMRKQGLGRLTYESKCVTFSLRMPRA